MLNEDLKEGLGRGLTSVIVTNAAMYSDTDFACWTAISDRKVTDLTSTYDSHAKTLTIKSQDGSPIDLFKMRDIHFGAKAKDINLCDPSSQYYSIKDGKLPSLDGPQAEVFLTSATPGVLRELKMDLKLLKTGVISLYWTFSSTEGLEKTPFEVPLDLVDAKKGDLSSDKKLSDFVTVSQPEKGSMSITIKNSAGTEVWTLNGMLLTEYLNLIDATASTVSKDNFKGVMGLAERTSSDLFLPDGVYSLWSRDIPNPIEDGKAPGKNLYGTHPLYMGQASDKTWFGVFTNLAAAQDWWIKNDVGGDTGPGSVKLTTIAAGGVADIYIMLGAGPNEVTTLYHTVVGKPVLTPQWALGWNQCRWGYGSTEELEWVVGNYSKHQLPLDVQWSDIDYLDNYRDFTYDKKRFDGLPDFVKGLHEKNMRYIPIIDAGLAQRPGEEQAYTAYNDGVKEDVFIKTSAGEIATGQVWPDDAAFPDFFQKSTPGWWGKWLTNFHD